MAWYSEDYIVQSRLPNSITITKTVISKDPVTGVETPQDVDVIQQDIVVKNQDNVERDMVVTFDDLLQVGDLINVNDAFEVTRWLLNGTF